LNSPIAFAMGLFVLVPHVRVEASMAGAEHF
jgi:hypothetical protein